MKKISLLYLFGMILLSACENENNSVLEINNLEDCLYDNAGFLVISTVTDMSTYSDSLFLTRAIQSIQIDSIVGYDTKTFVTSGTAYFNQQPNNTMLQPYVYYVTRKYNYSNTLTVPHNAIVAWITPNDNEQMGYIPGTLSSGYIQELISSSVNGDVYRVTTTVTEINSTVSGQTLPSTVYLPFRVTNPNYLTFKYMFMN